MPSIEQTCLFPRLQLFITSPPKTYGSFDVFEVQRVFDAIEAYIIQRYSVSANIFLLKNKT